MDVKVLLQRTAKYFWTEHVRKKGDDLPRMLHMHWLPFLSLGLSFQGMMSRHALPHFVLIKMKKREKKVKLT